MKIAKDEIYNGTRNEMHSKNKLKMENANLQECIGWQQQQTTVK
jgi:hypothetical protein